MRIISHRFTIAAAALRKHHVAASRAHRHAAHPLLALFIGTDDHGISHMIAYPRSQEWRRLQRHGGNGVDIRQCMPAISYKARNWPGFQSMHCATWRGTNETEGAGLLRRLSDGLEWVCRVNRK